MVCYVLRFGLRVSVCGVGFLLLVFVVCCGCRVCGFVFRVGLCLCVLFVLVCCVMMCCGLGFGLWLVALLFCC